MTDEEYKKKIEAQLMELALSKGTMYGNHIKVSVNRYYAKYHYLTTEEIILTAKAMDFIEDVVN
jgi:hypothetical protein